MKIVLYSHYILSINYYLVIRLIKITFYNKAVERMEKMIMKKSKIRMLSLVIATGVIATMFSACGGTSDKKETKEPAASNAPVVAKDVNFWYFWKGDEGKVIEDIVAKFNASQKNYVIKGLSVPDNQKIVTAIAGGDGPDVIAGLNSDVPSYASQSMIEALDSYISKDKIDLSKINKNSLLANQYNGKTFGLPNSSTIIQMFYNKDLLKEAGYTEPPKTMEELYDMSIKMTKKDDQGNITQMGYPIFPVKAYVLEGAYAFGARYINSDKTALTPDNQGTIKALEMNYKFRKELGVDKVNKYVATSNTARYTPQDQFFVGKQAFRFDGVWLCNMIKQNNANLNYGIAPIPGTKSNPENLGASRLETDAFMIPTTAKEKNGAWEFIKYMTFGEGAKLYAVNKGDIPALLELGKDADVTNMRGMKEFIDILNMNKSVPFPIFADSAKYMTMLVDYSDYVYDGKKTPEEAMKELKKVTETMKLK